MIDVERIKELARQKSVEKTDNGQRDATREETIIRQNCLAHADAMFGKLTSSKPSQTLKEDLEEYFKFAEACESWVLRGVKR